MVIFMKYRTEKNKRFKVSATVLMFVACLCFPAISEVEDELADFYGDDDFISIATGSKQLIYQAPSTASVITAEDIKIMGATDIDDALESVPGLHVSYSSTGNLPQYIFRGISGSFNPQVLMLINGIPVTNLLAGDRSQMWGGMPVQAISRIEVIRGPGSAVYGADAFAGVINIITRTAEDSGKNTVGLRAGSYNTKDFWLSYADNESELKTAIIFESYQTNGYDAVIEKDRQSFFDQIFSTSASLAPGKMNNSRQGFDLRLDLLYKNWHFRSGIQRRRRLGLGVGLAQALDPISMGKSLRTNLDLSYQQKAIGNSHNWDLDYQISFFNSTSESEKNYQLFPSGADIGFGAPFPDGVIGTPELFEEHYRFNIKAQYRGFDQHQLDIGSGFVYRDLYRIKERKNFAFGPNGQFLPPGSPVVDVSDTPFVFNKEGNRISRYLFIQDSWELANDWQATTGLRYDYYSDFGGTINPRFALVWSTSLNLTSKFLYGKAFRAPSFAETRNINNPVVLGNSQLEPEQIETLEVALDYRIQNDLHVGGNVFLSHWADIIQFVPDAGGASNTAQNVGKQETFGIELEFDWKLSKALSLKGNFALQKSHDELTDAQTPLAPSNQLYIRLDWKANEDLLLHLRANRVSGRVRSVFDTRSAIKDYTLVDFTANWQMQLEPLEMTLIVKNLFDQDAREPTPFGQFIDNDLPLAGRSAYLQISYNY